MVIRTFLLHDGEKKGRLLEKRSVYSFFLASLLEQSYDNKKQEMNF